MPTTTADTADTLEDYCANTAPDLHYNSHISPYAHHIALPDDITAANAAYDYPGLVFASRETGSVFETETGDIGL